LTWVKLDDGFYRHPKARAAGKDGRALFLAACCWSASNLTDGHIPDTAIPMLLADAQVRYKTVTTLEVVGLFCRNGDGWNINDYLTYNESRDQVLKRRARWRSYKDSTLDSTAESPLDSIAEDGGKDEHSTAESPRNLRAPVPVPVLKHPPGPVSSRERARDPAGRVGVLNERAGLVLQACLDVELEQRHGEIRKPTAWRTRMTERRWQQYAPDIERLTALYPTTDARKLAVVIVTGDKTALRYEERAP
jgi:hypothetical protein